MNPSNSTPGGGVPRQPQQPSTPATQQTAATNILRAQIDALYGGEPVATPHTPVQQQPQQAAPVQQHTTPAVQPRYQVHPQQQVQQVPTHLQQAQQQPANTRQTVATQPTYGRTYPTTHAQPQADKWKAYHSAWQDYYQKYYAGYYNAQQKQVTSALTQELESAKRAAQEAQQRQQATPAEPAYDGTISQDQALVELRQKLLGNVKKQATKIRKSRHFMPIAAAVLVMLIFVFIQFNRVFIGAVYAYVSPGSINPQNIIIDPTADNTVGPEPRLIIPKINVDVPVIYDTKPDYQSQMDAMWKGVAYFGIPGANSKPGQVGNTVLAGHSSNDVFDQGDYKFIFVQLEKMTVGDKIYANYEGKRYTYKVTKTETVKPTDVNKLVYPTDKPVMTLITCTPIGTALNRFLVTAEQISPDPTTAEPAPGDSGDQAAAENADEKMPGNSPTILERMFGAR